MHGQQHAQAGVLKSVRQARYLEAKASSPVLREHAKAVQLVGNASRKPLGAAGASRGLVGGGVVELGVAETDHATTCAIAADVVAVAAAAGEPACVSPCASSA